MYGIVYYPIHNIEIERGHNENKRTNSYREIERGSIFFKFAINLKSIMESLFTEMLNGTRNVKSVMDILFITIEIEGAIVAQVARVQSQSVKES